MEKHVAFNVLTGEIVGCSTASHLRRCIKVINHQNGGYCKWIFGHRGWASISQARIYANMRRYGV